jgi:hypothetical protein
MPSQDYIVHFNTFYTKKACILTSIGIIQRFFSQKIQNKVKIMISTVSSSKSIKAKKQKKAARKS